ncbi:sensor histidine kinase [Actinomadura sp. 3N407]|uniref:sensor histidine kinase n=1 Tax=Actinomadura sp. 3N407 TaxID=3457423 RepID=UPI003FCC44B0
MKLRKHAEVIGACGLAVALVAGTLAGRRQGEPVGPLEIALLVLPSLAVAARRRAPLAVAAGTSVTAAAYYALGGPGICAAVPAVIGIYTLMGAGARLAAVLVGASLAAAMYVIEAARRAGDHESFLWIVGWVTAMLVIGEMTRNRRDYLLAVEQRAAEAERTREEAALRRAGEERLWIAQELHDTLTHSISVINVQAGMAVHLIDRDPARGREALIVIKEAGRDAMRELRGTLGILRQVDGDGGEPGLDRLPRLVERARAAGLTTNYEVRGEPRRLPADVDRAAYRILQEALTNVLRHAGRAPVSVIIEYRPGKVVLAVDNDRAGCGTPPAAGSGMGLVGMRERAMAVGGTLTAGPVADGGFRVRAELPL